MASLLRSSPTIPLRPTSDTTIGSFPTVLPPKPIYELSGATGHRTLWVVTVVMAISSLAFYAMAYRAPTQKRLLHILTAFVTTFSFIAYYALATGDGKILGHIQKIKEHGKGSIPNVYQDIYREVYWARYVDWALTTPLLLLDLSLLAGLSGANILVAVVADLIMVLTGLFAAFSGQNEAKKWGYYAWACIAFITVFYQVLLNGRRAVASKGSKTSTFFHSIVLYTLIVWLLFPIVWGIADESRRINVNSEIIAYAVLDILAKPVFGFWLLFTHDSVTEAALNIDGFWASGVGREGTVRLVDDGEGA